MKIPSNRNDTSAPTVAEAAVVFAAVLGVLMYGILKLKLSAHLPLIAAASVVVLYGTAVRGISLRAFDKMITESLQKVPVLFLLAVGILIASWVLSGTVPYLVSLGLRFLSPDWFLVFALLASAGLAVITGSSWTTCATLGVAFYAISLSMGIPGGMTAAAVVGGAFWGEKQSPLSDTTVLAASTSRCDVMEHIKYMLYASIPVLLISAGYFWILGLRYSPDGADLGQIQAIQDALQNHFHLSPWTLLSPAVLGLCLYFKIPAVFTMLLSACVAMVQAAVIQQVPAGQLLSMIYGGVSLDTGNAIVNAVCNRGGFVSMTSNITMLICAMCFSSALEGTGVISVLVGSISPWIRSRFSLAAATLVSSSFVMFFTGAPAIGFVITGNALGDTYDEKGLDRVVLARTVSSAASLQQPLVPWGASGAFVAQCYGLSVLEIAPYYWTGYLMPVAALLLVLFGIGCPGKKENE